VKILRSTVVERYSMEFMLVEKSFVQKDKGIHKVPVTASEALGSSLMGFFEKRNAASFLEFVSNYNEQTEMAKKNGKNLRAMTTAQLFKEYSLGSSTITFLGHAVALFNNDDYLQQPAYEAVMYGGSPYVYPLYGSGELPQAFSRLSAVYGGTFMLETPVHNVSFDVDGKFESIQYGEGLKAKAKFIVGDPTYFKDRVKSVGQVVRCIAILDHPIKTGEKEPSKSMQIIIPQSEAGRKSDVYVLQLSNENQVCPPGFFIAIVGTTVENPSNPMADLEAGMRPRTFSTCSSVSTVSSTTSTRSSSRPRPPPLPLPPPKLCICILGAPPPNL
jgi:Rab GDP dissociation inhibitor